MGKLLIDSIQAARPAGDRRLPAGHRDAVHRHQPWSTSSIRCSIRACASRAARHDRRQRSTASPRRGRRRRSGASSSDFCESRLAVVGLALLVLILLVAIVRAADLAAEPLRSGAARHHGRQAAAGLAIERRRHDLLARHRRPGPRHAVGDLLRPAHQPVRRRRSARDRARHRLASGWPRPISAAGSRALHHAHRRHPAVVSRRS